MHIPMIKKEKALAKFRKGSWMQEDTLKDNPYKMRLFTK